MERVPGKAFARARPVATPRQVPRPFVLVPAMRTDLQEVQLEPGAWLHGAVPAEARIMTPDGPRAAGLLAPGDVILTLDDGAQPLAWVGRRAVTARQMAERPNLGPVVIPRNAFGGGCPRVALHLSPRAGMLLMLPGGPETGVLIEAREMLGLHGIHPAPARGVTYVQLLPERHAIMVADGLPVETFHPAVLAPTPENRRLRAEVFACFPELEHGPDLYGPDVRPRAERQR